jgi:hypothetical protein
MLARIPSRLLSEWLAFDAIEPFGERRADLRAAQIVTAIANVNRDPKTRKEPYTIEEFVLRFDAPPSGSPRADEASTGGGQNQTWQQQKAIMMALTAKG